jgi:hypothetical protein
MDLYKETIVNEIVNLHLEDKREIKNMIKRYDSAKLQEFGDGIRINLDKLPDDLVMAIYKIMKYKLGLDDIN